MNKVLKSRGVVKVITEDMFIFSDYESFKPTKSQMEIFLEGGKEKGSCSVKEHSDSYTEKESYSTGLHRMLNDLKKILTGKKFC